MTKVMRTTSRYVQGKDALLEIKKHTEELGNSLFIIASKTAAKVTKDKIEKSFAGTDTKIVFEVFNGISSMDEINRLRKLVQENKSNVIVGAGGGSTLDAAKAVAYFEKLPIVIVPTIAATDAPCSALSVIYTNEHKFSKYMYYPKNPDAVIVDTKIIANAPVRFFVAGMGDALATYFEARACKKSNAFNCVGGHITNAGMAIAQLCHDTLMKDGYKAKLAIQNKAVTEAVENAVEANIYMSGVGFENGGIAAAHSIYDGFTVLEECKKMLHGELVAFGTLVQLILENSPMEEIEEVIDFCLDVGLPITLEEVGVTDKERAMVGAKAACAEGETVHNILGDVTPEQLYDAILAADELGRQYL